MNGWMLFAQQAASTAAESTAVESFDWRAWLSAPVTRLGIMALVGALGLWFIFPGGRRRTRALGSVLAIIAGALMFTAAECPPISLLTCSFWMLSGLALASAVASVTSRSPVYAAIWFAVTLLAVGGLFLVNGAQFLGVATVAVYAGAIVVTFLFVLMLAQPEGQPFYDRVSWGNIPSLSACIAGTCLAAAVIWSVTQLPLEHSAAESATAAKRVLAEQHVARLGGQLFTKYLIAVQMAAALLMAALVGTIAMAIHGSKEYRERRDAQLAGLSPAAAGGGPSAGASESTPGGQP